MESNDVKTSPSSDPTEGRDRPTVVTDGGLEDTGREPKPQLERISDGYVATTPNGEITGINSAAADVLGLNRDDSIGQSIESQIPDDALLEEWVRATSHGTDHSFSIYDDGLGRWIDGRVYPMEDGFELYFQDITEQTVLQTQLGKSEAALERMHDIAADTELTVMEKIERLLDVGTNRLGTSFGFLTNFESGTQTIVESVGDLPELQPGSKAPLSESYCRHTIGEKEPVAVSAAGKEGWEDDPAYQRFELECYLGAPIFVDDEQYGTVCFTDNTPRKTPFTERELTFAELLTDWIRYLLEQQAYERQLEHQKAFTESLINCLPDPMFAFDSDGSLIQWNKSVVDVSGYTPEELDGKEIEEFVTESDVDRAREAFQAVLDGDPITVELTMAANTEIQLPFEVSGAPLRDETGEIIGSVGVGRDISERIAYQERLSAILDTTRSLMQAKDRNHVAEIAVTAAQELLGFEANIFRLYDSETETLEPVAMTEKAKELMGERPIYDLGEGNPGEVFASGEPRRISNLGFEMSDGQFGDASAALVYPVGVHGTISVCATDPDQFDETDEKILGLLATSAAAACMRAKREEEVRNAQEHTEQVLDRVNGLIENTIEVLVQATTRDEIEAGVVRELASADPYEFAWIGRPDVSNESLRPTNWDGEGTVSLQGHSFSLASHGEPVSDTYRDGEVHILQQGTDELVGPWREIIQESDIEAVIVVPLTYKETNYGVLCVCATDDVVRDERERIVLEAIGHAVANTINAIERGRILDATEVIELEFAISDEDLLFNRLSGDQSKIEIVGTEYQSDGSVRLYLTASDVDPKTFLRRVTQDGETADVTCIVEHDDECLVELTVEQSLLATVTEYGAIPQTVITEAGTTKFTVEIPYESEARELFTVVEETYPGTELLGYHERERAIETPQEFKAELSDRLTDRQQTALQTAYLGGFFDWPRDVDGNELADAMEISRPTYHQHLRAAQAKVFEELFE